VGVKRSSSRRQWWVVVVTAGLAVVGLILLNNLQAGPVAAEIDLSTATPIGNGDVRVQISWTFPSNPEDVQVAEVAIPASQVDVGTVDVWPTTERDGQPGFTLIDPSYQLTPGDYILAVVLGALLGIVMVMTVRGYGYVRGTGEPGSHPRVDVAEDRGFYWRT
jgi:hypothetical protein